MDILHGIDHRMNLLEKTHRDLNDDMGKISWDTDELDNKINTELLLLKKETQELLSECEEIRKQVFSIGALLKNMATKQELETFEKKAHEWLVHEYITKKELNTTFDRYAKR